MKLLLFDIDGTILLTRGTGRRAVEAALSRLCGRTMSTRDVSFGGRTDPQIIRDVLVVNGLSDVDAQALLPEALATYAATIRDLLDPADVHLLPGVADLIAHLAERPSVQLALLTGNLESMAYLKLAAVGLSSYFPFGAFGSDHEDRYVLPPIAVQRAYHHTGHHYTGKNVVIIGDTQHDILCGRGIGAFAVAVCTGPFCRTDLEPHGPDLLFDDLCDVASFVRTVVDAA